MLCEEFRRNHAVAKNVYDIYLLMKRLLSLRLSQRKNIRQINYIDQIVYLFISTFSKSLSVLSLLLPKICYKQRVKVKCIAAL